MERKMVLTGISFIHNSTVFYDYNDLYALQFYKCLIDSDVLKSISKILLRYEDEAEEPFFVKIKPDYTENQWVVEDNNSSEYAFRHNEERSFLDEIEEQLPDYYSRMKSSSLKMAEA